MSRRGTVLTLGRPDIADQLYKIGQRLAALESRFAFVENSQAGFSARIDAVEAGSGPSSAENTLASSTLIAGQVLGVSAIFTGLYSRLSSIAARSQAQADRLADLDARIAALEAA